MNTELMKAVEQLDYTGAAAAVRDAERYRWIRSRVGVDFTWGKYTPFLPAGHTRVNPIDTDESIDAALAQRPKPMTDETDDLVNRLFDVTERYECLKRAVNEHHCSVWILDRAEEIERERGLLKGDEG